MSGYGFVVGLSVVVLASLIGLMRSRRIREKYAAVWIALGLGIIVVCVWPNLAVSLARLVGVETPSNLVFAVALVILLGVCIQLSVALSAQEEQSRTLAEEIALIRCTLDEAGISDKTSHPTPVPDDGTEGPHTD
ncbi:hypothetical protein Sked_08970 [Sanguibacter keddieii DSM 10542]|jgi:hypothetical protein|uniref:DUF2304 domain-containing protein n=1 Tax=Sanguibacter keddieii (strain ATCC 51767 / DSM 10542 / NCFB 3025 / ST-74) TaxID=446469 RepID=D1BC68_SANKS|nr:DUF2304 domain-containing protein [Sanguibacter keddieii]ACZ20848.1 hypothetical protein Sked_08970 [Sanguibacter keddieii DSM 10542]